MSYIIKFKRYLISTILVISLLLVAFTPGTVNAEYPERSINVFIGFSAGGPTDVIGRGVVPLLEEELDVGMGITNMPGAASATAGRHVLNQKADGYSLFFGSEAMSVWQTMGINEELNPYEDFYPVKLVAEATPVLAVPPNSEFDSAEEFVDYAIENPGELRIGTAGPGTVPHVSGLILEKQLGAEFTFVPYQGGAPAVTAVMGSQVDATIEMVQSMVEAHKANKLKILATFTNEPLKGLESIPTFGDQFPELQSYLPYGPYFGLFASKDLPQDVKDKLESAMNKVIATQRWDEYCEKFYLTQIDYSGEEAVDYLRGWTSRAAWVLYDTGAAKNSPAEFNIPKP
ncbi:MAG: tripartite tricarboxylate transporter substrate binding protein [Halanaerobiales bacterium]|nr:tripartite tricarboxylate transporter substrate binding protein [Halanaerobiales bacterium]